LNFPNELIINIKEVNYGIYDLSLEKPNWS